MPDAATFAVDSLAAYRLTRLLVDDTIADVPRAHVLEAARVAGWEGLAELLRCYWCAGMWVSVGVVTARRLMPDTWDLIARSLAASAVTGLIASRLD